MNDTVAPSSRGSSWGLGLLTASLGIGLVLFIHRDSPRTLLSAHGFLHSAILQRFQQGFSVPPENPFFAGEPLGYYWFFQALGAAVSSLTGLDPIHSFELLVCLALAGLVAAAFRLAFHLYGSAPLGALIAFLVLAGANVQAPLLLLYRVLRVGPSVLDERPEYLWGIVHNMSTQFRYADQWGMHGPLLNFFLNVTARPLALCAAFGVLLAFQRMLAGPTAKRSALLVLSVALTGSLSVLSGAAVAGSLCAALCLVRLAARTPLSRWLEPAIGATLDDRRALATAAALIGGLLLAAPTYWHLFATGSGGLAIAADGLGGIVRALVMLLAACWFSLLLAVVGTGVLRERFPRLAGVRDESRAFIVVLLVAALGLIGGTALVTLPVGNQDNFFHVALVMLAVAAPAAAIDRNGAVHPLRAWLIGLLFLPTLLLVAYCYVGRPPIALGFDGTELVHTGADRGALYAYVRAQTPENAVFVIDADALDDAMSGNTPELPALTRRTLFVVRESHYIVAPYPDRLRRAALGRRLFSGEPIAPDDAAYLAALGRPLYVVDYHADDGDDFARRSARDGDALFRRGKASVHRYDPGHHATDAAR